MLIVLAAIINLNPSAREQWSALVGPQLMQFGQPSQTEPVTVPEEPSPAVDETQRNIADIDTPNLWVGLESPHNARPSSPCANHCEVLGVVLPALACVFDRDAIVPERLQAPSDAKSPQRRCASRMR